MSNIKKKRERDTTKTASSIDPIKPSEMTTREEIQSEVVVGSQDEDFNGFVPAQVALSYDQAFTVPVTNEAQADILREEIPGNLVQLGITDNW